MKDYANAKSRIKEETGRKCEAMSFGTNFSMKEFYYSKMKRENKNTKRKLYIWLSSKTLFLPGLPNPP